MSRAPRCLLTRLTLPPPPRRAAARCARLHPRSSARRDAPCQYQSSCRGCHCGSCQAVKSSGRHASHAEISALTLYIHPNPFFVGLRAGPCLPALPARSCLRPCLLAFAASVITDSFRRPIQTSVTGWPTTTRTSRPRVPVRVHVSHLAEDCLSGAHSRRREGPALWVPRQNGPAATVHGRGK